MDDITFDKSEKKRNKKKEKRCHANAQGECTVMPVEVGNKRHRKGEDTILVNDKDICSGALHLSDATKLKPAKKRKRYEEPKIHEGNCKQNKVVVSGVEAEKRSKMKKSARTGYDDINEIKSSEISEGRENYLSADIRGKSLAAKEKENKNKKRRRNEDCTTNVHEEKVIKDDRNMNKVKKKTESEASVGISYEGKGTEVGSDSKKKKKKNKEAASAGIVSEDRMTKEDNDADLLNNKGKNRDDKDKEVRSHGSGGVLKSKGMAEASKPSSNSASERNSKNVRFSGLVEVFPSRSAGYGDQNPNDGLVRGKRYSPEEDELIRTAVFNYIENHGLGEKGLDMVLNCREYRKEVKGCWKEISTALPWRPLESVYGRAHVLFERGEGGKWSEEDYQVILKLHKEYGSKWKEIGNELGRCRRDVKDAFRRYKETAKKGHWSQEEYQKLFDLVSEDLRMKALTCVVKKKMHGMLRDNISWTAISGKLATRIDSDCCVKWYNQLQSALVQEGKWADVDDYRMLATLVDIDASCEEDVDWDNLLDNRSGEVCLERWNQMVRYIGEHGMKTFPEQVEILSQRYSPELAEVREKYDSLPVVN